MPCTKITWKYNLAKFNKENHLKKKIIINL